MRKVRGFVVVLVATGLGVIAVPADARPGATQDPDDTSYKNDIRAVYHNDAGSTITYHLQFFGDINPTDWRCYIGLDFNEDAKPGPHDALGPQPEEDAQMDITLEDGGSVSLHDRNYERSGNASLSREPVGSPHAASGSTAKNTIKLSTSKGAFVSVGMAANDTGYRYAVGCGSTNSPGTWGDYPDHGDRAPDNYESYPIVHRFGSGGGTVTTPKPNPATQKPATPAPSASAPASSTSPPTADPTQTPSPSPTATSESTDAAPTTSVLAFEESADDGGGLFPIVAGALVAGGLASAVGLTLLRRRAG